MLDYNEFPNKFTTGIDHETLREMVEIGRGKERYRLTRNRFGNGLCDANISLVVYYYITTLSIIIHFK